MSTTKTANPSKCRFFRAKGKPTDCEYDPANDDTEGSAWGAMIVGISGWFECAACGDPKGSEGGTIRTPEAHMYAYGLCQACKKAHSDETHFARSPTRLVPDERGKMQEIPASLFTEPAPMNGRIGARLKQELERFIANGEPEPEGP